MQASSSTMAGAFRAAAGWRSDALVASAAAAAFLAAQLAGGMRSLFDSVGDNDSLMRMVQVRDLMAGQGWFDPMQYRMGLEGGFEMHWSRLVDAPVAGLVLLFSAAGAPIRIAELAAATLWPLVLFTAALFLILRLVRQLGAGEEAVLPAVLIGALSLHFVGIFKPGTLDHHNLQLVLTLAMVSLLIDGERLPFAGAAAGICAAAMLAVGMETAPYVAVGGLAAALLFLLHGRRAAHAAAGFGAGFGLAALVLFAAAVPPARWGEIHCDALSSAQAATAAVAGFGLGLLALLPAANGGFRSRALGLLALGLAAAALMLAVAPQCLADPYAGLDPRLRAYWLDEVAEARSLAGILAGRPAMALKYFGAALLGAAVFVLAMRRGGATREKLIFGGVLAAALAVSVWQVRGTMFLIPLAAVPLAGWVAGWRLRARADTRPAASLMMCLAWLLSFGITWSLAADGLERVTASSASGRAGAAEREVCYRHSDYDRLAALPPATVLAVSNLGAPILHATPHRVFAGPYHRNVAGNLLALDTLMGTEAEARAALARHGAALIAHCPGNDETAFLARTAPEGLLAALVRGEVPDWLELVEGSEGEPVRIYRTR